MKHGGQELQSDQKNNYSNDLGPIVGRWRFKAREQNEKENTGAIVLVTIFRTTVLLGIDQQESQVREYPAHDNLCIYIILVFFILYYI